MSSRGPVAPPSENADTDLPASAAHSRAGWRFLRALLVSLLTGPICCFWAQDQAVDRIYSLMVPPVALTLALVIVNVPLRRFAPRWAFSEGEMVIFYAMQAVMCAVASEWMDVIAPRIYSYALFEERNPRYATRILPYVSDWLFFKTNEGLKDFASGGKGFRYFIAHLDIWWPKIIAWTVLASLVAFAMLCINSLMRDQWINREKLAFPIVQLSLAMTQGGGSSPFWRNRLLWIAFFIMFGIDMLNGFAFLFPSLPMINVRFLGDMNTWFSAPPWNQTGWTPIGIFPFISALGVFMPTDLLVSLLFFFFARKAQQVIAYSLGYEQGVFGGGGLVPSAPYFSEQSWGAFLGLFVTALWLARPYLREVWRQIVEGHPAGERRLVPHRWAFLGLIFSLGALGLVGLAIGLPFMFVVFYTAIFLAFSLAVTRLRAQLGAPTHEMAFMGPNQLLVDFRGTVGVQPDFVARTVTAFHFMNRIHRTHPMPSELDGIYLAERTGLSQRGMFVAILLAIVAGNVLGHLVRIHLGYRWTPGDAGGDTTNVVATLTETPRPPNPTAVFAVFCGLGVVLMLDFVRFRLPGFPLHPAGYALAMNFGVDYYWFGLLLVLLIKVFIQRYYGFGGMEKLRPLAFGVILGEFAAEAIWATFSMLNDRQITYTISINGKMGWNQ